MINDDQRDRNKLMLSNLLQQLQWQFQLVIFSHPVFMQLTVLTGVHHLSSCLLLGLAIYATYLSRTRSW